MPRPVAIADYFWKRVARLGPDDCWAWMGNLSDKGYGLVFHKYRSKLRAHRVAYELTKGDPGSLHVLHRCNNRSCVNPAHLWLGTNADNVEDRRRKGRSNRLRGEQQPSAKLTDADVIAIRESNDNGPQLARRFGVSVSTISLVRQRKHWKHVA